MFGKNIITISFFISLSRILGFIRDIIIAKFLGIGLLSDVFFAAFRVPNFFRRIFAEGAFNSAFIPLFIDKNNNQNKEVTKNFVANISAWLLLILWLVVICFQLFMPFLMKVFFPGFFQSAEKSQLLISLSHITIFYLVFIVMVSLLSSILNSINKFAIPSATQLILNLTLIFFITVLGNYFSNYAYSLAWGVFFAGVFQLLFIAFFSYRYCYLFMPQLPKINTDFKIFLKKLVPGLIGANVMQINLLIDSFFASSIVGAVSYLYYADRINQLPLATIGIAISMALLPNIAKKIKAGESEKANHLQNTALEVGLLLAIPASLALTVLAENIVGVLFERGAFNHSETIKVGLALKYYSFGLPAYILVKIFEPTFFARSNTKTPMKIAIFCVLVNILLNCIFAFYNFSYLGIILSSIIASYLNFTLLFYLAWQKKYFHFIEKFWQKIAKILVSAIIMAMILQFCKNYFGNNLWQIWQLAITIIIGFLIYFIFTYATGCFALLKQIAKTNK
jgi:putative peptidoglycan lipid II flippase